MKTTIAKSIGCRTRRTTGHSCGNSCSNKYNTGGHRMARVPPLFLQNGCKWGGWGHRPQVGGNAPRVTIPRQQPNTGRRQVQQLRRGLPPRSLLALCNPSYSTLTFMH